LLTTSSTTPPSINTQSLILKKTNKQLHAMVDISGLDLTNVFKLINLTVGILAVLGGISQFFPVSFQSTIIAIYVILIGIGIVLLGE
jgi:hypothetical protein